MKILVLGAGRMGHGAAWDLVRNSGVEVTVADVDRARLDHVASTVGGVTTALLDATDHDNVLQLMRGHDSAIGCVSYKLNVGFARAAIEAGVHFCDLGGNNDVVDAELALHDQARDAGVNIVPDCGLAPGMVSILAVHGAATFDRIDSVHIRVGGLPQQPQPPLDYAIFFSVEGLINEYVEPARVLRGGRLVTVESMTELEELEFKAPFGRLEAFQTSGGTSTLVQTFAGRLRDLDYKTIRYPGHCAKVKAMLDLGLGSSDPVVVDGVSVAPRRLFEKLLGTHLPGDAPDAVLVRIDFEGEKGGARERLRYEIIDLLDGTTGMSAMMRTTAFPASIIAQMMARGETLEKGALPQERCIPAEPFMRELARRNIKVEITRG